MALTPWSPALRSYQAAGEYWTAPQTPTVMQETFLLRIPIWQKAPRPWRVKGEDKKATKTATRPGQIVSVDQLESNTPGLIAQLKGKLTQQRYNLNMLLCLWISSQVILLYTCRNDSPVKKQ